MKRQHWLLLVMTVLLSLLQYGLWFSHGNSGDVIVIKENVDRRTQENQSLRQRNFELAAEVEDLKSGEAAVEDRARSELGMIKPGEKFYRVVGVPITHDTLQPLETNTVLQNSEKTAIAEEN